MQIFIQLIEHEEETFFLPTFNLSHSIILSRPQHNVFTVVACTADVILGSKNHWFHLQDLYVVTPEHIPFCILMLLF